MVSFSGLIHTLGARHPSLLRARLSCHSVEERAVHSCSSVFVLSQQGARIILQDNNTATLWPENFTSVKL